MIATLLVAALAISSISWGVDAQTRPSEGCSSVNVETSCVAYPGCKVSPILLLLLFLFYTPNKYDPLKYILLFFLPFPYDA